MRFKKHIFICTHERPEGQKKSCGESAGFELIGAFRSALSEFPELAEQIRVQRSGCLDACEHGPSMVIYPDGVFYGPVTPADVQEIVTEHLLNGRILTKLEIQFQR
jgi:(2Fe-2S) ferredoxin